MNTDDSDRTNHGQHAPQARATDPLRALAALTGIIRHGLGQPLLGLRLAEAIASRQAADRSASTTTSAPAPSPAPSPALGQAVAGLAAVNTSLETFGAVTRATAAPAPGTFNPTAFQAGQARRLTEKLGTAPDVRWWIAPRLTGVVLSLALAREITTELLLNAARACGDDRIICGLHPTHHGDAVRIRVAHGGTAVPDAVRDWLAAPPDELTAAPVHRSGHLGLGLTAIRLALAAVGGQLSARNGSDGFGVLMTATLPVPGPSVMG